VTRRPDAFDELAAKTGRSRDEVIETWSERAAIRQYLGGLSRDMAEQLALEDTRDLLSHGLSGSSMSSK
jgi:hypothetical protein